MPKLRSGKDTNGDNNAAYNPLNRWVFVDALASGNSLAVENLREIIEQHGWIPNDNNYVGGNSFFRFVCRNERVTEGIIRCLLECFPNAASVAGVGSGCLPLHHACRNPNVTLGIIRLLVCAAPDSVCSVDNEGWMPLHDLCSNSKVDEIAAIEIMKFLLEKHPDSVRHANNRGSLPIHNASERRSLEFCRVLIEAYPGSEQITTTNGNLPLHSACSIGSLATVEYLYKLYPDAILCPAMSNGCYPIHLAIGGANYRENPATAVEIVKFLLDCDPDQKLIQFEGKSLLGISCALEYADSAIDTAIDVIKIIFDAHPEAIEDSNVASNIHRYHLKVQSFINGELVYARQASNHRLITTPDDNGRLPLHTALQNNVTLGSIKLLVKGNPSAIRTFDQSGAIPLHIACEHHDSSTVVKCLIDVDATTLDAVDRYGDTVLHYACRGAKYDTIAVLLGSYDAVSVSKRNAQKKLPIELLWESTTVEERGRVKYTESVFRLLKAYPETLTNIGTELQSASMESGNGKKKRKFGDD